MARTDHNQPVPARPNHNRFHVPTRAFGDRGRGGERDESVNGESLYNTAVFIVPLVGPRIPRIPRIPRSKNLIFTTDIYKY